MEVGLPRRTTSAVIAAALAWGAPAFASPQLEQGPAVSPGQLATSGMDTLAGQRATCEGSRVKTFRLKVEETAVALGAGTTFNAWTYDGRLPGPTLEVCEGDRVMIEVMNSGTTSHGLDTHALAIDARKFGPVAPGSVLRITGEAETPGVFMYHCAAGPVTDYHIKSGLHGAMVVHPRRAMREVTHELVVVESAIYAERSETGLISGTNSKRTLENDFAFRVFNGRLEHEPLLVSAGDLVRVYHVNVGPGVSAAHVIGSMWELVVDGADERHQVQTYGVPPGGGALLEFRVPETGDFVFVNHDQLGYVPIGLALTFRARAP